MTFRFISIVIKMTIICSFRNKWFDRDVLRSRFTANLKLLHMSGGQRKSFSILGPKLSESMTQQDYGNKYLQIQYMFKSVSKRLIINNRSCYQKNPWIHITNNGIMSIVYDQGWHGLIHPDFIHPDLSG